MTEDEIKIELGLMKKRLRELKRVDETKLRGKALNKHLIAKSIVQAAIAVIEEEIITGKAYLEQ